MPGLFRVPPALPKEAYQTFAVKVPVKYQRTAECSEVECNGYLNGWETFVDESTDLGQSQAHYIRVLSRRRFTEQRNDVGITVFTFVPGQTCFNEHKVQAGPENYVVRSGDWRGGNLLRRHTRAEDWVEDFSLHQQAIIDQRNRG